MRYIESCSCGATIEMPTVEAPYRWEDQWGRFQETLFEWRKNHRHRLDLMMGADLPLKERGTVALEDVDEDIPMIGDDE